MPVIVNVLVFIIVLSLVVWKKMRFKIKYIYKSREDDDKIDDVLKSQQGYKASSK
jgi:hypothetical protein